MNRVILAWGALSLLTIPAWAGTVSEGKAVYDAACAACHNSGAAGAPRAGDVAAWKARFEGGLERLTRSALNGKGAMPARGGNTTLSEAAVQAAVIYLVGLVGEKIAAGAPARPSNPSRGLVAGAGASGEKGRAIFDAGCAACHAAGIAGAPKLGDAIAWAPRIKAGFEALYANAVNGLRAMPAKGGNSALSNSDTRAAVDYMVAMAGAKAPSTGGEPTVDRTPAKSREPTSQAPAAGIDRVPASPGTAALPKVPPSRVTSSGDVNAFNRLLRPPGRRNLPPMEDGIHDPTNDGTGMLQPPLLAYEGFARSNSGNRVDWVRTLGEGAIRPRADRNDPNAAAAVMDLNIVREVKGSMPDVVYPHKQHTEWLDCANCHPAIFVPQKGANQISMASILLGQKCGVCHGKVAFPISECRLCHSRNKPQATTAARN